MIVKFPLDDHFVCLDTNTEQLTIANTVGTRILEMYSNGLSAQNIAATLHREFNVSRQQADHDVDVWVGQLQSNLLKQHKPQQHYKPTQDYEPYRAVNTQAQLYVYLPNATICVQSESRDVIAQLEPLFELSKSIVQSQRTLHVSVFEYLERFPVVINGKTLDTGHSPGEAAILCMRAIYTLSTELESHASTFHAAAVSLDDKGILLPALGGSGKTTLTAYLLSQGFSLLNDDSVQLSAPPCKLIPVPMPLSIKAGSWKLLNTWYPQLDQQLGFGSHGHYSRFIPPQDAQVCRLPVRCSLVCFPRYVAGSSTHMCNIDRATALTLLVESGCYLPRPVEAAHLQALVDWAQTLQFYTLEFSELAEAERALRSCIQ